MALLMFRTFGVIIVSFIVLIMYVLHRKKNGKFIKRKAVNEEEKIKYQKWEKIINVMAVVGLLILGIFITVPCCLDIPYLLSNNLVEYSGWAGDLVTLMGQIIKYDENKTNNELIKYGNSLIGANSTNTLFNEKDMQADVDSINLSKQISNSFYIEIINYYYKENDVRKNNMREFKKYLLEKENSQTIYEAVKNNFSKNKVYINALINSLTNSNIAQKYKENQEKYIEIMAQIFENYFLKNL